jgi:hypothetical protein
MDWLAPSLSLLVAVGLLVARSLPSGQEPSRAAKPVWMALGTGIGAAVVLALFSFVLRSGHPELADGLIYAAIGVVFMALLSYLEPGRSTAYDRITPLAVALGIFVLFDQKGMKDAAPAVLGLVFGGGFAAVWFRFAAGCRWPSDAAWWLAAVGSANLLGAIGVGGKSSLGGSSIGLVLIVASVLGIGLAQFLPGKKAAGSAVFALVAALGLWLVAKRHLFLVDIFWIGLLSIGVAFAVAYLLGSDDTEAAPPSSSFLLSAILWVAAATIAFGMLKGYGMAIGLIVGAATLSMLGSTRGLLTMGPLFGLTAYRLFREQHTDSSRAFDIGQHYAMVGILIGLLLVLLLFDWGRERSRGGTSTALAGVLLGVAGLGGLLASVVLLGPKGTVGLLVGIGLAPAMAGWRGSRDDGVLACAVGLLAATAFAYGPLDPYLSLEREAKTKLLLWTVAIVLGLAAIVRALAGPMKQERG